MRRAIFTALAAACLAFPASAGARHRTGDAQREYQYEGAALQLAVAQTVYFIDVADDTGAQQKWCRTAKAAWRCSVGLWQRYTDSSGTHIDWCWVTVFVYRHWWTMPERLNGCTDWIEGDSTPRKI